MIGHTNKQTDKLNRDYNFMFVNKNNINKNIIFELDRMENLILSEN